MNALLACIRLKAFNEYCFLPKRTSYFFIRTTDYVQRSKSLSTEVCCSKINIQRSKERDINGTALELLSERRSRTEITFISINALKKIVDKILEP